MFFSRSGGLVKRSVSRGQASDALDGDRPERPGRVLLVDRHEAAVEQDPPPVVEARAARSPGSRRPAAGPRCRRGARPARSRPRRATGRYRSASGSGVGRHRDRRAPRAGRRSRARIAVFQSQPLQLPDPEPDEDRHPEDAEDQRRDHPAASYESAAGNLRLARCQGQSAESGKPVASKGARRTSSSRLRRPDEHPGAVAQREGLEQPPPPDRGATGSPTPVRAVERPLLGQVEAAGPRAQDLADPVRHELDRRACPERSPCARGASRRGPAPPRRRRGAAPARWRSTSRPGPPTPSS